jgi:hypothetical protein
MLTTAVLERLKTNTRRLEKVLERVVAEYEKQYGEPFEIITQYWDEKRKKVCCLTKQGVIHVGTRYKLGEVVAVTQAYKDIKEYNPESYEDVMLDQGTICESSHPYSHLMRSGGWDNKMFVRADLMPHQIQMTGVRIERLQAITDDDVYKEGFTREAINNNWGNAAWHCEAVLVYYDRLGRTRTIQDRDPREAFAALNNRPGVGRKCLWEKNPFVVVYEFKLVK